MDTQRFIEYEQREAKHFFMLDCKEDFSQSKNKEKLRTPVALNN